MGLIGGLGGGTPQDLDLDTIELFTYFIPLEELITSYQLHDLSVREVIILKAAVLHEMGRQIVLGAALGDAVRTRFRDVWNRLRPQTAV
jgi:hypothetical protein